MNANKIMPRKIFFLDEKESNTQQFERLFAIADPLILSLAEQTALLFDSAVNEDGQVTFSELLDIIKQQDNMSLAGTKKKTFSEEKKTVAQAIEMVYNFINTFWGADLDSAQHKQLQIYTDNVFMNLADQQDFPWISWVEKKKTHTIYQYNMFFASNNAGENIFFFDVPIILMIDIQLPYNKILALKKEDEILFSLEIQGVKVAQLIESGY